MEVPVKLDIPEKYVKDVLSGRIDVSKAVLRNTDSGKIVKHVDLLIDNKDTEKDIVENFGVKKLGIAGVIVGGVALVGFGVYKVVKSFSKDKKIEMPKCVNNFYKKLNKYLEEASKGIINPDSIDNVLKAIDDIEKFKDPTIRIDFSTKEVKDLLNSIYEFNTKLNKNEKNNIVKFKAPSNNSEDNIIYLKDYLKYQKELATAE